MYNSTDSGEKNMISFLKGVDNTSEVWIWDFMWEQVPSLESETG